MKLLSTAFKATLDKFGIKGQHLSVDAGVSEGMISHFRNGKGIRTESLEKMLASFSDEAFTYWLSQMAHGRGISKFIHDPIALSEFVEDLDKDATAQLLTALAGKIRNGNPKKAESPPTAAK